MSFPEYDNYDAVGLAELIGTGQVTQQEVLESALERLAEHNGKLNAVIHLIEPQAPEDGPLQGVPFLMKDMVSHIKGEPLRRGSRFLENHISDHDSNLTRRYRQAGLVILGKTNTPELGLQPTTEPALFGPTRNPWDLERTPGGSSGGSAAAVAAGMVPAAHGGDGGGSIRIPASCCGLFGLKPTRGRTPCGPSAWPGWNGATVEHVLTRSVRDSAAILDATAGPDAGAPYFPPPPENPFLDAVSEDPRPLRIAMTTRGFFADHLDTACKDAVSEAAQLLENLGHTVVQAHPELEDEAFADAFLTMLAGETAAEVHLAQEMMGRKAGWQDFESITWALSSVGRALSAQDYAVAMTVIARECRKLGRFFETFDVMLTPTLARLPLKLGSLTPGIGERAVSRAVRALRAGGALKAMGAVREMAQRAFDFVPFTPPFNASGQPAMSVPLHWHEGLPVGVHLVGRYADEFTLFQLAGQLERARPWFEQRPSLS